MKMSPAMLGFEKLFCVFFILHLSIWNINGEKSCETQSYIKRHSKLIVLAGDPFQLECPVTYCANRPNVTWCKFKENECSDLGDRHQGHATWKVRNNISVFILYFNQALPSDNGSYRCSVNAPEAHIESHAITIYVTEQTQNNSEHPLINATIASEPPSKNEMKDRQLILYSLLPLGGLPLLVTCFYLFCCLRRHQGKQKKISDTAERGINLGDVPQPFRSEQTEVGTRPNSQILPSEARVYDHDKDPWFGVQQESVVYSNPCLGENKQSIVYASLNHSIVEMNPRQAGRVKEAPTEYAAICVKSSI